MQRIGEISHQLRAVIATRLILGCRQGYAGRQPHPRQRHVIAHPCQPGRQIGQQRHGDRLEIEQQGIRRHVIGPQWLAVKVARVGRWQRKRLLIEHDVAVDAAQPQALQAPQQQPQTLLHQRRVPQALNHQIALEHTGTQAARQPHRGAPGVGRAEQVERGIGGDQLHDRGRVHRRIRLVAKLRSRLAIRVSQHETDRVQRDLRLRQRRRDAVGQRLRQRDQTKATDSRQHRQGACQMPGAGHRFKAAEPRQAVGTIFFVKAHGMTTPLPKAHTCMLPATPIGIRPPIAVSSPPGPCLSVQFEQEPQGLTHQNME